MRISLTRRRSVAVAATAALVAACGLAFAGTATASPAGGHHTNRPENPYAPSTGHHYRHGAIPTRERNAKMKAWNHANVAATGPKTLSYGGGVDGIGVQSGHSKVYLVLYGTQWGTQTTSNGISSFSGDANHAAEAAQNMFKGIGTNSELWSADLTQWCDGPNVASGATSCPANANFIPYQSGGVLSGVWYDNSKASPSCRDRGPARHRGRLRGEPLRQHHRGLEPGRVLRDHVPARHQPGQLPGLLLRLARLER